MESLKIYLSLSARKMSQSRPRQVVELHVSVVQRNSQYRTVAVGDGDPVNPAVQTDRVKW